ncbi:jg1224 [Pararge aegeria aegeria]|uniref:Jg1224 protein n=1 Tax=Pararge aegeria aegeria TaxID=348720 RepID=A0A8S4R875_9NEOP|nr:jg1224 [Pararge aegeria aegeria]
MQKKLFFVLPLTSIFCWADSLPVDLGSLEFDNLDTDISNLKYEVQNGDLDDFFKPSEKENEKKSQDSPKSRDNASEFKKKSSDSKGVKVKFDIENLKKFLKQAGLHDIGSYDDGAIYAIAKGLSKSGVGITGNEDRKYRKGTKTKGFHKISHKDEYNKEKEFYEEDETSGVIKKKGAKGVGFNIGAGAGIKQGYFHHDREKGLFGKEGFSNKGKSKKEDEGFSDSQGFDAYFNSE